MQGYPVEVRFPMHWGEMDALGHANNTRYFAWFETARIEVFQRIGLSATGAPTVGPILATTTCDFLVPVVWPAELVVSARIAKVGTTSFAMDYTVATADAPEVAKARGTAVIVLIDYTTGKKVPISDTLRARIAALG